MNRFDPLGSLKKALGRTFSRGRCLTGLALGLLLVLAGCSGSKTGTMHLPPQDSNLAAQVDWLYYFVFWTCMFYLVHITLVMLWFMWKYRRQPGVEPEDSPSHNLPLEIAWSIPPCILVVLFFYWGFTGYIDMTTPPADAYKIQCIGTQWKFRFVYPNGGTSLELHVPKDEPVEMLLESEDVLHSFYVPRFRVKQDLVPGRINEVWFTATTATKPGEHFWLFCAEYCGDDHALMRSKVIVHETRAEFDAFVKSLERELTGEEVYNMHCAACHLKTSGITVGPSFKGLFGSKRQVLDTKTGKVIEITADTDYIMESIKVPGTKLSREGREFTNAMSAGLDSKMSANELQALIDYMRDELK